MSFDLRIHFVGLNLFVPEPAKQMHVLLPATKGHERHHARIIYDEAYRDRSSEQLSRKYYHIDIEDCAVDLTGMPVREPGIDTFLPMELPTIEDYTRPVERRHVSGPPDKEVVTARLSMDSGALTFYGLGARFNLKVSESVERTQRMTVRTEWTIRGIDSEVLKIKDLVGPGERKIPELFPIGNTIHLMVFHAVAQEFPPQGEDFKIPRQNKPADHFDAYYVVCPPNDPESRPKPWPAESVDVLCTGAKVPKEGEETPGMTCVGAQARLASGSDSRDAKGNFAADSDPQGSRGVPVGQHVA